jgi:hypothetical protein
MILWQMEWIKEIMKEGNTNYLHNLIGMQLFRNL